MMNVTTEREPFTKPLTGYERRYILQQIDQVRRGENTKLAAIQISKLNFDYVREVEEALEAYYAMKPRALANLKESEAKVT